MAFQKGTSADANAATDYKDALVKLAALLSRPYVATALVNAGGTGYVVDDILTVAGGTTIKDAATIRVTSVSGGVIDGVEVAEHGSYSADPSTTANAVTGGSGSGATMDLTMAGGGRHVSAVAVNAGGTGYAVDDILTVAGGTTAEGLAATLRVTAVSAGVITAIIVENAGSYKVDPTTTANAVTGGSGSGATMDLTMANTGWVTHRMIDDGTEWEWIGEGEGSGSEEIFVGIRTYRDVGASAYNWEVAGFTGFNSELAWVDQAGFSNKATYVPIAGSDTSDVEYWYSVKGTRVRGNLKVGTSYPNFYLGFPNRFSTPGEFPYPLAVFGCSSRQNKAFNESDIFMSGLTDPIYDTSTGGSSEGPAALRFTDGQWYAIRNSGGSGGTRNDSDERVVYPCGSIDPTTIGQAEDRFILVSPDSLDWGKVIGRVGVSPNPSGRLHPTPDSGGDITVPIATVIQFTTPSEQIVGELDGVFWISTAGSGIVSEDVLIDPGNGDRYICFQNCNRNDQFAFMAVRQE